MKAIQVFSFWISYPASFPGKEIALNRSLAQKQRGYAVFLSFNNRITKGKTEPSNDRYFCKGQNLAGKDVYLNQNEAITDAISQTPPNFPPCRLVERKIGNATFIVSSRFNDDKEKDIVSTITRLIGYGGE